MEGGVKAAVIQVRILLDHAIHRHSVCAEHGAGLGPGFAVMAEAIGGVAAGAFVEAFRPDIDESDKRFAIGPPAAAGADLFVIRRCGQGTRRAPLIAIVVAD